MTKITGLEQKTFQGKPSGWKITFDDGRSGNLQEKESTKGLRVGDSVDVKEIPYTSKAGVTSTLYAATLIGQTSAPTSAPTNPSTPPASPSIGMYGSKNPQERKREMQWEGYLTLMGHAITGLNNGKLTREEAKQTFMEWKAISDDCLNELWGR